MLGKPPRASWTKRLDHGSVQGFPSYKEVTSLLNKWLQQYPEALQRRRIGSSYQGRPLYAYVVGAQAGTAPERKPKVLVTSLMHAREPAGLTVVLYFLGHLLEQRAAGVASAMYAVSMREIWLVPFVNPDGYVENEGQGQGLRWQRKNMRPICNKSGEVGVDINRNFGFHWQKSSDCGEFSGARPFSEPETQAIKKMCEDNNFVAALNFHSFGEMLTHPFNYVDKFVLPSEDQRIFDEFGKAFKWKKVGPAKSLLGYHASGASDDWMYGVKHIFSMSPEIGHDFWLKRSEIAGINAQNFDRISYLVQKAGLELNVVWKHEQTPQISWNEPPVVKNMFKDNVSVLQLELINRGLSASGGNSLRIAVSGAVGMGPAGSTSAASNSTAAVVGNSSRVLPVELHRAGSPAAPAISIHLTPLQPRSKQHVKFIIPDSWKPSGIRKVSICAQESGTAKSKGICHCAGPVALPAVMDAKSTTTAELAASLTLASTVQGTTEEKRLCAITARL